VGDLTVNEGVSAHIYFRGNLTTKGKDTNNNNADGPVQNWTWFYTDATARTSATGFVAGDIGKIAYQDGAPGTYWKLTATAPTWVAYTPTSPNLTAADTVSVPPVAITAQNPPKWIYANAATRTAATGFLAADVGKIGYQTDTQAYYTLTASTPTWTALPYTASPLVSRAGHLWYYGISPADGSARSITINPPGSMYAAFYAPSYDFTSNGNPDIYGVAVTKTFYQNGNCSFHFDKQLALSSPPLDYRVASYVEDVR
jgi:hypothetical protein